MLSFSNLSWGQEIAGVSETEEFMPAVVRITLQNATKGEYNIDTGKWEGGTEAETIYEGRARMAPIRWGVDAKESQVFNASTTVRMRVQIPQAANLTDVPRGTRVKVIEAPRAQHMVGATFVVTLDAQNSDNGARNLETEWNSDVG